MRTSIVHLPTDAMKIHFTNPMSPLVLSAGIRRKNEIIEIFLYSLFWSVPVQKNEHMVMDRTVFSGAGMSG
jgi:hypothetical protein